MLSFSSLFDTATLLIGLLVFAARIVDVTVGTMRTLAIVQGRTWSSFFLGFVEVSLWLVVISTVIQRISAEPFLGLFYALGFATGNVVGIKLEKRLGFGHQVLRIFTRDPDLAGAVRDAGFAATTFAGEGLTGPVIEVLVVCRRRDCQGLLPLIRDLDPEAFYLTEMTGTVSRICRPFLQRPTGWRATAKMK